MKKIIKLVLVLYIAINLGGCGKPNDPESIYNPGEYKLIGTYQTTGYANDVLVDDSVCFIAQGEGGLCIVDIKDRSYPKHLITITENVRGYSRYLCKYQNHLFISAGSFGFTSINVSNINSPTVSSSNISMKPAKEATVVNNYLIAAISEQGVNFAQLADNGIPDIRGKVATKGYAQSVAVTGDSSTLFVACGEMGVQAFDLSVFEDGYGPYPELDWINTNGYAASIDLSEDKKCLLVASESAGLIVIDYSNRSELKIISTYPTERDLVSVKVDGSLAYLCLGKAGLEIIDFSDPANLKSVARFAFLNTIGCDFDSQYIYVANENDGIAIIKKP